MSFGGYSGSQATEKRSCLWQLVSPQKVSGLCCVSAGCCQQRVRRVVWSSFPPSPCDRYGHFSGINRKVQLTYLPHGHLKAASEDEGKET